MSLPWRIALEAADYPAGLALAVEQPASEILRLISSDLAEMSRAVQVYRALPVQSSEESVRGGNVGGVAAGDSASGANTGVSATTLLRFADGTPLLVVGAPLATASNAASNETAPPAAEREPQSAGLVLYLAVAPEVAWTNLPTKPLMVPLLHEVVRQGLSMIRASQKAEVGEQPTLAQAGPAARDLRAPDGRVIPLTRGRPQQPLESAGVYDITDASNQNIGLLAVNIDPRAGITDVQSAAAVGAWLTKSAPWTTFDPEGIASTLGGSVSGSPLAGILLAIVLGLLVLETMFARWFSHAYRAESEGDRFSIKPSMGGRVPASAAIASSPSSAMREGAAA
jgi:hypothetical protein